MKRLAPYLLLLSSLFQSYSAFSASPPDLLLANVYEQSINVTEYWVSEKYDGVRAYWNGKQLLSREGNAFQAPEWFVTSLPPQKLDGELWIARRQFEKVVSTVSKYAPVDEEWRQVKFMVFELPDEEGDFSTRYQRMREIVGHSESPFLQVVEQFRVSSQAELMSKLNEVVKAGAEGLMLHKADANYRTGRSDTLLKLKPYQDAEARVIKHLPGKGKYKGLLGALLVETKAGVRFKIGSGFSDAERRQPPPIGATITYKYFGKTQKGIPRFASFLRIRPQEIVIP